MLSFAAPNWQTAILASNRRSSAFTHGASLIVPRVYLSDYFTARDEKQLLELGITHVLSVMDREPVIPDCVPQNRRLRINIADHKDVDILKYLDETTEFIRAALAENEENNVLVHCLQGISRSATVVCAYLVATTTMTASEAVSYAQAKRSVVCPNPGFRNQLQKYSTQFFGNNAKRPGSAVSRISEGIATRIRELKAVTGSTPTAAKKEGAVS